MEASALVTALAALILLAVASMRYGVDSRECLASKERELAARGIIWGGSPARDHLIAREAQEARARRLTAA